MYSLSSASHSWTIVSCDSSGVSQARSSTLCNGASQAIPEVLDGIEIGRVGREVEHALLKQVAMHERSGEDRRAIVQEAALLSVVDVEVVLMLSHRSWLIPVKCCQSCVKSIDEPSRRVQAWACARKRTSARKQGSGPDGSRRTRKRKNKKQRERGKG